MKKIRIIGVSLLVAGIACQALGFFLYVDATNRNLNGSPIPPDPSDLRQDQLPGYLIQWVGGILIVVGGVISLYYFIDQWRIASRRKSPMAEIRGEVWFCPKCGNLDIKGSDYCSRCGELLPKELVLKSSPGARGSR